VKEETAVHRKKLAHAEQCQQAGALVDVKADAREHRPEETDHKKPYQELGVKHALERVAGENEEA
jgi:hypothetical protein